MENEKQLNTVNETEEPAYMKATGMLQYKFTNDGMFHIVLQRNEKVLRGLIGSLLHLKQEEIEKVEITNPIMPGEDISDKEIILDIRLILNDAQLINLEMQVANTGSWPERSLTYLCRNFDNLKAGEDYDKVKPCLHIGIIDFDLFEHDEDHEFYSKYRLGNVNNHRLYTTKFGINVLNLRHVDNATEDDIADGLDVWAKAFKATTWEELKMLAEEYENIKEVATSIFAVSEDEAVKLYLEARERYDRDMLSSHNFGVRQGREQEQANTQREKERADAAEERADAEKERADAAEARIKELEEALRKNNIEVSGS
ncbi:MAG: Rpn family recombination-promoting nuclease/putative transposase [Lachnospiraceae bacterium]|nr:Rpn family recombination-promoting nuclease/putative transposase [Lachnospiraceae bacterium]